MRLIDADALEKYLSDAEIEATRQRKYVFASALNTICGNVRNFPTIEPERKKGKWINKKNIYGVAYCSECDYELHTDDTNFCPNCGSRMCQ